MKKPINASQVPELELSLRPGTTSVNLQRRSRPRRFSLLLSLVLGLSAGVACASDPVGIYALVDKVVMEPNEQAPENIQIWGAFSFAKGNWDEYEPPQRGFLYYKLNPEKPEVSRKEWADLKSVAGARQCVGFANRHKAKGHLRKADEKPKDPDVYPLGWGIQKMRDADYPPVKALLALKPGKTSEVRPVDPVPKLGSRR